MGCDRPVAARGVDIGVTQPAGLHPDQDLTPPGLGDGQVADLHGGVEVSDNGGLHGALRSVVMDNGGNCLKDSGFQRQAEWFGAVADEQVLRLAVVIEHHAVVLAADTGDLVTAERRACGVLVVAVGPDAAGLDAAAHRVGAVAVARPHPGAEAVEGVVGDRQRLGVVGEGGHREHRAEDLLLEHAHLVVALEHGRLEVVPVANSPPSMVARWPPINTSAPSSRPISHVGGDLLELLLGHLRADQGLGVERVALLDRG